MSFIVLSNRKNSKNWNTKIITVIVSKCSSSVLLCNMRSKDASRMSKSVDPEKAASPGAI